MESRKKTKIVSLSRLWRIFALGAFLISSRARNQGYGFAMFLFSLTLGLGITTAFRANEIFKVQKIPIPQISLWEFISSFLLATFFILLIVRFVKFKKEKGIIFKILFALAIFSGGGLLLSVWISDSLAFPLMVILIFWWFKKPSILIQNLLIILGIAGAGSILGLSLNPQVVILLLILFSIYDFIAVYKTKHMIKMAKEMIKSKAILALVVPPNISGFKKDLGEIKPGGKFLVLGGGDIVFPLLLAASLVPFGVLNSLVVAFFSLIGLFVSFYIFTSQKVRQPIPALPPIALFSIIGYLITLFI